MKERLPGGRKRCRHCGEIVVGLRTQTCPHCEGDISRVQKPGENPDGGVKRIFRFPEGYNIPDGLIMRVDHQAGECPIRLRLENDTLPADETILQWAEQVRQKYLDDHKQYLTNSALTALAVQELNWNLRFPPRGDEMKYLRLVLDGLPDLTFTEVEV
jgi:hypothetical protein